MSSVEILDRHTCVALLAGQSVGRLSVVVGRQPVIFPVNFSMVGDDVIFRTDRGLKLDASEDRLVAFEADAVDESTRSGWSVVVQGRATEIRLFDLEAMSGLLGLDLDPYAPGPKQHWMRIVPVWITGRRITSAAPADDPPIDGEGSHAADGPDGEPPPAVPQESGSLS